MSCQGKWEARKATEAELWNERTGLSCIRAYVIFIRIVCEDGRECTSGKYVRVSVCGHGVGGSEGRWEAFSNSSQGTGGQKMWEAVETTDWQLN